MPQMSNSAESAKKALIPPVLFAFNFLFSVLPIFPKNITGILENEANPANIPFKICSECRAIRILSLVIIVILPFKPDGFGHHIFADFVIDVRLVSLA